MTPFHFLLGLLKLNFPQVFKISNYQKTYKLKEMMKDNMFINNPQKMPKTNYEDLKRMVFLLTDKFNRGGLMARR